MGGDCGAGEIGDPLRSGLLWEMLSDLKRIPCVQDRTLPLIVMAFNSSCNSLTFTMVKVLSRTQSNESYLVRCKQIFPNS